MRGWSIVAALWIGGSLGGCGTRADSNQESHEPVEAPAATPSDAPAEAEANPAPGPFVFDTSPTKTGEARLEAFAAYVAGLQTETHAEVPELAIELDTLAERIERELARLEGKAEVSVHARHLPSGVVLFDHEGATPRNPASNHKLVTASAALDLLGPDYRFATWVLRSEGRLYLIGQGDPSVDGEALRGLAKQVAANVELDAIETLIVDDSAFSERLVGPGYDPEQGNGASFVAPSGALSLNFNTVEIVVDGEPSKKSKRPGVSLLDASAHIVVDNKLRLGSGPSAVKVASRVEQVEGIEGRMGTRTRIELRGTVARGDRVKLRKRVADPALYTGGAFARMLARAERSAPTLDAEFGWAPAYSTALLDELATQELPQRIGSFPRSAEDTTLVDLELVGVLRSEPLHELVSRLMAFSNNVMAENILRTLAWRITDKPGDWDHGAEVLGRYWLALGNPAESLQVVNGSGLSEAGRVAPAALVELLALSTRTQLPDQRLVDTLPIGGKSGTLADRLSGTHQRVRAKTGTLDEVSGLSGFILDAEGEPAIAFSILINNLEGQKLGAGTRHRVEDRIVEHLLASLD